MAIQRNFRAQQRSPSIEEIAMSYGIEQPKPKANILQRILAPLGGIGSIPDVVYDTLYRGKNPFTTYAGNVARGLGTAFTGNLYDEDIKRTSDILKRVGLTGNDFPTRLLREGLGLAGDIVADPLNWITFGTAGFGDDVAKVIGKQFTANTGRALGDDVIEELATKGLSSAVKSLGKSDDITDLANIALAYKPQKTMKFLGQSSPITDQRVIQAFGALTNPLGFSIKGGAKLAKKGLNRIGDAGMTPLGDQIEDTLLRAFSRTGLGKKRGLSYLTNLKERSLKELQGADLEVAVREGKVLKGLSELGEGVRFDPEGYKEFAKKVGEGVIGEDTAREVYQGYIIPHLYEMGLGDYAQAALGRSSLDPNAVLSTIKDREKYFIAKDLLNRSGIFDVLEKASKGRSNASKESAQLFNELVNFASRIGTKDGYRGVRVPKELVPDVVGAIKFFIENDQAAESLTKRFPELVGANMADEFGRTGARNLLNIGVVPEGNLESLYSDLIENISEKDLKRIASLGDTLIGQQKDLVKRGLLERVITPGESITDTDYLPRKVLGYNEEFFKQRYGKEASKVIDKFDNELKEKGYVSAKTLDEYNRKVMSSTQKRASIGEFKHPTTEIPGLTSPRVYETQREGVISGVIYEPNQAVVMHDYLTKGKKTKVVQDFYNRLKTTLDDKGEKILYRRDELKKLGLLKDGDAPFTFTEIDLGGDLGKEKYFIDKQTYSMIKGYEEDLLSLEGSADVLNLYDKGLNFVKGIFTGYGPNFIGFNVKNAIGDMNNMILGGFRNRDGAFNKAMKSLDFIDTAQREGLDVAQKKFGKEVTELTKEAIDKNIFQGISWDSLTGQSFSRVKNFASKKKGFGDYADKFFMRDTMIKREDAFRLANFWDAFKRTGNWEEAASLARRSSLDYGNMTRFEKEVMKRVIPFYSFMKQNLNFQIGILSDNPKILANQMKVFNSIKDTFGANMSQEDWEALPAWMRQGLSFAVGRRGDNVDVLTGFGDPTSAIADTIGDGGGLAGISTLQNLLSASSPAIRVPLELASDKNYFTGRPISEERYGGRYSAFPEPIRNLIGYRNVGGRETVNPYAAYALGAIPGISGISTMTKRFGDAGIIGGGDFNPKYLIPLGTGARIYSRNIQQEKINRERELRRSLEDELYRSGIGNRYTNFYIPQGG